MSSEIRPCKKEDLKAVHELSAKHTSFDATPTLADTEGLYARNPDYFYVAVGDSGEIIGFITGYERKGIPEEVLSNWNATRVGYIDLMTVDVPHRRKGVGTMLMNKLLDHFRTNGIDLVILDVPAQQLPAVRLYQRLGFEVRSFNMRKHLT
jgi:ribosomal protein S18 acetylase RimI-like enzyme